MRRTLGTALALPVLLLSGCSGGDATGSDPAPTSTETSTSSPTESPAESPVESPVETPTEPEDTQTDGDAGQPVEYDVVSLLDATAAGGRTSPMLTLVDDPAALETFVSQFRLEDLAEQVRTEATSSSYDGRLWAAVVSVGCDVPTDVFVEEGEAGYLVTPAKIVDPLPNCLAAVTTVALVAIR